MGARVDSGAVSLLISGVVSGVGWDSGRLKLVMVFTALFLHGSTDGAAGRSCRLIFTSQQPGQAEACSGSGKCANPQWIVVALPAS
jgi:hypothetical protein